jgi:hypothetical protein
MRMPDEQNRALNRLRGGRTAAVFAAIVSAAVISQTACRTSLPVSALPTSLTDEAFWTLTTSLSEPAGVFEHSENLVSNEMYFVHAIRMLTRRGGVYIGVGPEQNFSYIAQVRPEMAFIIDIRAENRNLHLLYKALFELSIDRADFLSRLFSREAPQGLGPNTSVSDLFAAYDAARPAAPLYEANVRQVRERLLDAHRFPLSAPDVRWVEYALHAFFTDGPAIHYDRSRPGESPRPSYRTLMTAADGFGRSRSYLASEEAFAFVKDLHSRNLIVPVVGDFAGPGAIRRTGDYIRQHAGIVNAFYASNVEVYLTREKRHALCGSLATLPYDGRSWYIGSRNMQRFTSKLESCASAPR